MVKSSKIIKKRIIEELLLRLGDFLSDLPNYLVNPRPSELTLHYRSLEILRKKLKKEWAGRRVDNAFGQMKRSGYVKEQKVSGHSKYFLTLKGIEKILKLRIKLKLKKEELKQTKFTHAPFRQGGRRRVSPLIKIQQEATDLSAGLPG